MSIHVCDHCGKPIPDEATVCPHCGETIEEDIRLTRIPETIEELQAFCAAHKMPLDAMRFFIGEDFKGAKAFGIFKREDGTCVVYKNKSDGSRAIRYEGPDEKHAVREIYEKLKSETDLRRPPDKRDPSRSHDSAAESDSNEPLKLWEIIAGGLLFFWKPILIAVFIVLSIYWSFTSPKKGYYQYRDNTYYYQDYDWYYYNPALNDWEETYDVPDELEENYKDYYESKRYDDEYGVTDFSDSDYYESSSFFSSDSSYDDYDWDSDDYSSWDSSDTDWDSDW